MRRSFLLLLLFALVLHGGEARPTPAAAIVRGLAHLRTQQQADGGIAGRSRLGVTALAALAHLAAGVAPDRSEPGLALRRMLGFLCDGADARGWLGGDSGRMYAHALACLALTEALGTARDDDLDERLRRAIAAGVAVAVTAAQVEKAAPHRGGWRYAPDDRQSDASVTGWVLLALTAARRVGFAVPEAVLADGRAYLRGRLAEDGRMGYQTRGEDRPALRGLALRALGGEAADAALRGRVLARLRDEPAGWSGPWFFYRCYHDALGVAEADPAAWPAQRARLHDLLLPRQAEDGSWPAPPGDNERDQGPAYATAMAVLALSVDLRLLPAQRP